MVETSTNCNSSFVFEIFHCANKAKELQLTNIFSPPDSGLQNKKYYIDSSSSRHRLKGKGKFFVNDKIYLAMMGSMICEKVTSVQFPVSDQKTKNIIQKPHA